MRTVEFIRGHTHSSIKYDYIHPSSRGRTARIFSFSKFLVNTGDFLPVNIGTILIPQFTPDDDLTIRGRETTFVNGKWHVRTSEMRSSIFPLFPVPALGPPFKRPVVSPLPVGEASGYGQLPRLWRNASPNMLTTLQTGSSLFSNICGLCGNFVNYFLNFFNSISANIKVFSFLSRLSVVGFRCEAYLWRVGGAVTVIANLIVCFSKIWECSVVAEVLDISLALSLVLLERNEGTFLNLVAIVFTWVTMLATYWSAPG